MAMFCAAGEWEEGPSAYPASLLSSKLHLSPSFLDVREGLVLQPRLALNPIPPASASQVLEGREPDLLTNFPFAINDC